MQTNTVKTCIIVGNGALARDFSAEIDAAGYVLRFNNARTAGLRGGSRTDGLMMVNTNIGRRGKQGGYKIFHIEDFFRAAPTRAARQIIVPINPAIVTQHYQTALHRPSLFSRLFKDKILDWTPRIIAALGEEKTIIILSAQFYRQAAESLGISAQDRGQFFPSTGFLGICYCLQRFPPPHWQIKLCGFGWKGWERHLWQAERQWIAERQREGRLSFL